ncbi:hypothetical protein Plhal304r1_c070g0159081 [Plasmopara halstedii]
MANVPIRRLDNDRMPHAWLAMRCGDIYGMCLIRNLCCAIECLGKQDARKLAFLYRRVHYSCIAILYSDT